MNQFDPTLNKRGIPHLFEYLIDSPKFEMGELDKVGLMTALQQSQKVNCCGGLLHTREYISLNSIFFFSTKRNY